MIRRAQRIITKGHQNNQATTCELLGIHRSGGFALLHLPRLMMCMFAIRSGPQNRSNVLTRSMRKTCSGGSWANTCEFSCNACGLLLMKEVYPNCDDTDRDFVAIPETLRDWSKPVLAKGHRFQGDSVQYRNSMLFGGDAHKVWIDD